MSVYTRTKASERLLLAAKKHRALWGGTDAMRASGERYLPKFEAEELKDYQSRLKRSFLFNAYRKTIKDMGGRVFEKPVALNDAPDAVVEWAEDIDLQGRALTNFAQDVFEDALQAGVSFILVDAPRRDGAVTQAQAASQNLRPYFVHIEPEALIGWKWEVINNSPTLTQIRVMEYVTKPDPDDEFADFWVEQIRVMDVLGGSVGVRLYQKDQASKWIQVDEYAIPVSEIRLVPVYANRTGFMLGEPVLDDLADLNIAHWQSASDQRNILHVARVPILWGTGWPEDAKITIGTTVASMTSEIGATLQFAEHSGAAIGAGRDDLKDLEFLMQMQGLQLLVTQDRGTGATGAMLDAKKETSQLARIADNLEDALNQALAWLSDFGGFPEATCSVHKDFTATSITAQELQFLLQAVNTGQISRQTFLAEIVRRGVVSDDLDPGIEAETLDEQDALASQRQQEIFAQGAPDDAE